MKLTSIYESGNKIRCSFYESGYTSCELFFEKSEDDELAPTHAVKKWETAIKKKIEVRCVENGFIVKKDSKEHIMSDMYSLKEFIESSFVQEHEKTVPIDEITYEFENLQDVIENYMAK